MKFWKKFSINKIFLVIMTTKCLEITCGQMSTRKNFSSINAKMKGACISVWWIAVILFDYRKSRKPVEIQTVVA